MFVHEEKGGYWEQVRHLVKYDEVKLYEDIINDDFSGEEVYGHNEDNDQPWAIKFDVKTFSKFKMESIDQTKATEFIYDNDPDLMDKLYK